MVFCSDLCWNLQYTVYDQLGYNVDGFISMFAETSRLLELWTVRKSVMSSEEVFHCMQWDIGQHKWVEKCQMKFYLSKCNVLHITQ